MAAVHALASLAKESVPEQVNIAYGETKLNFGRDYIISKPFDPRLITVVAPAVAKAAMESGLPVRVRSTAMTRSTVCCATALNGSAREAQLAG